MLVQLPILFCISTLMIYIWIIIIFKPLTLQYFIENSFGSLWSTSSHANLVFLKLLFEIK